MIVAESYERIHRSNLVGMGILPLQYNNGQTAESLGLTGQETFTFNISDDLKPKQELVVQVRLQASQISYYFKVDWLMSQFLRLQMAKHSLRWFELTLRWKWTTTSTVESCHSWHAKFVDWTNNKLDTQPESDYIHGGGYNIEKYFANHGQSQNRFFTTQYNISFWDETIGCACPSSN